MLFYVVFFGSNFPLPTGCIERRMTKREIKKVLCYLGEG